MMRILKKYSILLFFINLTIWASLASTPLNEFFRPSARLNQIYSILLYLPFLLAVLWKFVQDIRDFQKNFVNYAYYLFAIYYIVLTGYRLLNGMEIKENLYYSIVLFGSVALYAQIQDKRLYMDADTYRANFNGILLYIIIYKIIATMLTVSIFGAPRILGNPPINNLYSTSMLVMLLPFMVDGLAKSSTSKIRLNWILLCLSLVLAGICESRAIIMLMFVILVLLACINLKERRLIIRLAIIVSVAVLLIALLAVMNVGEVRYALYRGLGISVELPDQTDANEIVQPEDTEPDDVETDPAVMPSTQIEPTTGDKNQDKLNAQAQTGRSDTMRSDLVKLGIEQVKLNPLFGTGDLFYSYDMGYKIMEQTAHNFLIECLVCYGAIGTILVALLLAAMLFRSGFFNKKISVRWQSRVSAVLVMFYFFAFGMVQPSVFNTLLCPLFTVIVAYYGVIFLPQSDASGFDKIGSVE